MDIRFSTSTIPTPRRSQPAPNSATCSSWSTTCSIGLGSQGARCCCRRSFPRATCPCDNDWFAATGPGSRIPRTDRRSVESEAARIEVRSSPVLHRGGQVVLAAEPDAAHRHGRWENRVRAEPGRDVPLSPPGGREFYGFADMATDPSGWVDVVWDPLRTMFSTDTYAGRDGCSIARWSPSLSRPRRCPSCCERTRSQIRAPLWARETGPREDGVDSVEHRDEPPTTDDAGCARRSRDLDDPD
jgi:hypothetical protein